MDGDENNQWYLYINQSVKFFCFVSFIAAKCKPPFHVLGGNCYYISRDKVSGDEAFVSYISIDLPNSTNPVFIFIFFSSSSSSDNPPPPFGSCSTCFVLILIFYSFVQARCSRMGAYLANFETLEEAMLMKQKLKRMNSGNVKSPITIIQVRRMGGSRSILIGIEWWVEVGVFWLVWDGWG